MYPVTYCFLLVNPYSTASNKNNTHTTLTITMTTIPADSSLLLGCFFKVVVNIVVVVTSAVVPSGVAVAVVISAVLHSSIFIL